MKNKEQKQQCIVLRSSNVFSKFEEATDDFAQAISEKMAEGYVLQGNPKLINGYLMVFMVDTSGIVSHMVQNTVDIQKTITDILEAEDEDVISHIAQKTVDIQKTITDIPEAEDEDEFPTPKPLRPDITGSYSPLSDKPAAYGLDEKRKPEKPDPEETLYTGDPEQPVDTGGDLNSLLNEEESESPVDGSPSAPDKQEEMMEDSLGEEKREDTKDEEENNGGEFVKPTEPEETTVTGKEESQEAKTNEVGGGTTENN